MKINNPNKEYIQKKCNISYKIKNKKSPVVGSLIHLDRKLYVNTPEEWIEFVMDNGEIEIILDEN